MKSDGRIVAVGDVVHERSERVEKPSLSDIERFVGLEHFDAGNLDIKKYGSTKDLGSTMKKCFKGDTLIARRNVYLKRSSRCNFDALCSGDAIVLRETDDVAPGFLPIVFNSDAFWKYASSNADGTMSKRLSVSHLKLYRFFLPPIKTQYKIVDLIWKIEELKIMLMSQLNELDLLIKSQFTKMFGDLRDNPKNWDTFELKTLSNEKTMPYGVAASAVKYNGELRYIRITDINDDGTLGEDRVSPSKYEERHILKNNDFLFARTGSVGKTFLYTSNNHEDAVFAGYLIKFAPDTQRINPIFLYHYTKTSYYEEFISSMSRGGVQPNINAKQYGSLKIRLPPLCLQNRFANFVKQVDKSKFKCHRLPIITKHIRRQ